MSEGMKAKEFCDFYFDWRDAQDAAKAGKWDGVRKFLDESVPALMAESDRLRHELEDLKDA